MKSISTVKFQPDQSLCTQHLSPPVLATQLQQQGQGELPGCPRCPENHRLNGGFAQVLALCHSGGHPLRSFCFERCNMWCCALPPRRSPGIPAVPSRLVRAVVWALPSSSTSKAAKIRLFFFFSPQRVDHKSSRTCQAAC